MNTLQADSTNKSDQCSRSCHFRWDKATLRVWMELGPLLYLLGPCLGSDKGSPPRSPDLLNLGEGVSLSADLPKERVMGLRGAMLWEGTGPATHRSCLAAGLVRKSSGSGVCTGWARHLPFRTTGDVSAAESSGRAGSGQQEGVGVAFIGGCSSGSPWPSL